MKRFLVILAFFGCLLAPEWANAHLLGPYQSVGRCTGAMIDDLTGDTIYLATIRDFYVFPKRKFRNKRQERFYWKTVRDVKKTLPYAKEIAKEIEKTGPMLQQMNRRQQRRFWKDYQKLLFARYEDDFRHMTVSQGQMLMLLVDRECGMSSYDCIKMFKGKSAAVFWQGIAKLFGNDMKVQYDGQDKDRIIEQVILLVEAGQL